MTKKSDISKIVSRRSILKAGAVGAAAMSAPMFYARNAWAEKSIGNYPVSGDTVKFGFNV
ncbi:MAG: twin-arginine translocation signal domain-containing protein, partial [Rhizobiales bacterium]|nr:twin-arginine translocation signal domain-containing protein [Hyphomicrobiales bacterium]